ncbi:acyl-CoA carboxylase subunit epsilon [Streptomyces sp. LP11]|uniref:Acyl-CoA carboxylase subunit epsilon n=1 Tax=Streptomyces pyxinicus TaxID=2970331 RepID=A0ABT2BEV1_9ACTN|nr:acyl-CoA carboxylase subunit epsilon [Streptomyces sp. LP11]MCS0606468.1 acyl-CoA carboxylase subunit epsilon [Streptomyces sp. LP11]
MTSTGTVLRVERGRATQEELAAVTVVVFSLLAARGEDAGAGQETGAPSWRTGRTGQDYRSPYSWQESQAL